MQSYTEVNCRLRDCMYYTPDPASSAKCRCVHPEKPHYMESGACPLYRLDWKRQASAMATTKNMKPR